MDKRLNQFATIYSWIMNNHWHTNFPLSQKGKSHFVIGFCHIVIDTIKLWRIVWNGTEFQAGSFAGTIQKQGL
jgi:type IV secretory pathway TrbF-like protein